MKRIFIAVDISAEAREKTAAYIDELRRAFPQLRVGWERREKLHLTLKFLGDVNVEELAEVREAVRKTAEEHEKFRVSLGGSGKFPPKGDPRTLWIGVEEGGMLAAIVSGLDARLLRLGFETEKRAFKPHLTIARLREPRSSAALSEMHLKKNFDPVVFDVPEIVIYESRLLPTGSTYTKIAALPLGIR